MDVTVASNDGLACTATVDGQEHTVHQVLLNGHEIQVNGEIRLDADVAEINDGQLGLLVQNGSRYECSKCGAPHYSRTAECQFCEEGTVKTA